MFSEIYKKNNYKIYNLIIFLPLVSFILGFYFNENSAGAGGYNGDSSWIRKNIDILHSHKVETSNNPMLNSPHNNNPTKTYRNIPQKIISDLTHEKEENTNSNTNIEWNSETSIETKIQYFEKLQVNTYKEQSLTRNMNVYTCTHTLSGANPSTRKSSTEPPIPNNNRYGIKHILKYLPNKQHTTTNKINIPILQARIIR